MGRVSLGDMAQTQMLSRQQGTIKAALQRAASELTTGKISDPGLTLRGDFRALAGIDAALARLDGYRAATSDAAMTATVLQSAVGKISDHADALGASLMTAASSGNRGQIDIAGRQAREDLRAIIATVNGRFSDRSLFAGTATATAPMPDADAWLQALQSSLGPVATAADVVTAVDAWFASPTGFEATYLGGNTDLVGAQSSLKTRRGGISCADQRLASGFGRRALLGRRSGLSAPWRCGGPH